MGVTGYSYTVQVYEYIPDNLGVGSNFQGVTGTTQLKKGWAPISSNGKLVNYLHPVRYDIRVNKSSAAVGGSAPVGRIGDDNGVKVVVFDSWRNTISSYATADGVLSGAEEGITGRGNTLFSFVVRATDAGVITPKIKVTLEPNSSENNTNEPLEVDIVSGAKMLTVNFTKAKKDPQLPSDLQTLVGSNRAQWNECKKEWVGMLLRTLPNNNVSVTLVYFSKEGDEIRRNYLGADTPNAKGKTTFLAKAQEELLAAVRAVCGGETGDPALPDTSILPPPNLDKVRYNPPNHFVTRSIAHGERTRDQLNSSNRFITSITDAQAALSNRNNRLGKIYQSTDGAKALNKKDKTGKRPLWGFKFTYNPTTLEYGTTTNTSIDWMLNSKDPANLLGGNTEVKVSLYLNRIVDMTELKNWRGGGYTQNYPRALTPEEVQGILKRGTEYDLEFLYRVLNGSPGNTALLSYPGETSDFGYITGTPCWFHLHDNLRYYGSMASLNVSHVMFTQEMVPMLSKVDISFIRYPSLDLSPAKVKEAYQAQASKVATTGEEPSTS